MTASIQSQAAALRDLAAALLAQESGIGVQFTALHAAVAQLVAAHAPAAHLTTGPPSNLPDRTHDPVLHVLTLLAYAVEDTRGPVPVRMLAVELARFCDLARRLAELPPEA